MTAGPRVAVVFYGAGNIRSVLNALTSVGARPQLVEDSRALMAADALVVPGVGHFEAAMNALRQRGLDRAVREWIQADRPFLGICLGLQLLYDESEESPGVPGLGVLRGTVRRLVAPKVPHMGWNTVSLSHPSRVLGAAEPFSAYFVHSYVVDPAEEKDVVGTTVYEKSFPSIVERRSLLATQFHPEKSGPAGVLMLKQFLDAV